MMLSMKVGLLWFMCGRLGIFPLTLARQQGVWNNIPDDIAVLEHTTARFNWLHTIRGNVHILWEHIGREGHREEVLAYARGHVDNSTLNYRRQRADYVTFPGSATMTLQNVSAYDEGTYEVSISSAAAGSVQGTSSVKLNVIPASNITLRMIIDGEIFRMSVAENGTNITLPEGQVVFLTNPSITVEVGEFVPTPFSIVTKYEFKENPNHESLDPKAVHSCDHCRKLSFSWFNDIYIKVTFNIQNADTIHIKKQIRNQVPWKSVPGNITVLVNTSALFSWIHDIPGPVDITWYYRKNDTQPAQRIMNNIDGVITTFPGQMSSRIRYVPDDRSAAVKLEHVVPSDEGFYEAVVADRGAAPMHNLSNVAKLNVIEESALKYDIRIDDDEYHLSFVNNDHAVTLPDAVVSVPVKHTVQVKTTKSNLVTDMISVTDNVDEQNMCRHTHKCASSFTLNSIQGNDEERNISIYINFGVQNLRNISLHYTLHLNSSRDQNNSKEHYIRDKNILIGVFAASTIILAITVAILVCQKKNKQSRRSENDADCRATSGGDGKDHGAGDPLNANNDTKGTGGAAVRDTPPGKC